MLPKPSNGTGKAVLRWGVDVTKLYADCQDRHRRTVEAWPKSKL